jgi:hypothetical protein
MNLFFPDRFDFKVKVLQALKDGLLDPGDDRAFKDNFLIANIAKDCKASEEKVMATFFEISTSYVKYLRNPAMPMDPLSDIDRKVFELVMEAEAEDSKIVPFISQPDDQDTAVFLLKKIVVVLAMIDDRFVDGLVKLDRMNLKASEMIDKIVHLTHQAEQLTHQAELLFKPVEDEEEEVVDDGGSGTVETERESRSTYFFVFVFVVSAVAVNFAMEVLKTPIRYEHLFRGGVAMFG